MTRPVASNGNTLTDIGWGIYDAQAFHINGADKWHLVASFPTGVTVRGKCGVMASTSEDDNNRAAHAEFYVA